MIYLDYNASAPIDERVLDVMAGYVKSRWVFRLSCWNFTDYSGIRPVCMILSSP